MPRHYIPTPLFIELLHPIILFSAHPETSVFGFGLSAIIFQLSAKDIKNKVLADR
jgi:hypothetical protein